MRTYESVVREVRNMILPMGDVDLGEFRALLGLAGEQLPRMASDEDGSVYFGRSKPSLAWLEAHETLPLSPSDGREALKASMNAFSGLLRWHEPAVIHNINPPVLLPAAAAASMAALLNPNALWDLVSGSVLSLEDQLIRQLGSLAGWRQPGGTMMFGGKAGLIYAIRMGLNRVVPNYSARGLAGVAERPVVLTTSENHYTVVHSCSLLGLGSEAVLEIPTDDAFRMDCAELSACAERLAANKVPVAAVILCGGNTLDHTVDNAEEAARALRAVYGDELPFLHLDTPVGWLWLFFRDYDWRRNHLEIGPETRARIRETCAQLSGIAAVDSFSVDFHKNGFAPYGSSAYVCRRRDELWSITRGERESWKDLPYGENFRLHHTLEHSRSAGPIMAAWVVLQSVGVDGFRSYVAHQMGIASSLRQRLEGAGFSVANPGGLGFAVLIVPNHDARQPSFGERMALADASHMEALNRYVFAFFRRTTRLDESSGPAVALGFVPGYRVGAADQGISVLRLYPMSPHLDENQVANVVDRLVGARAEMDGLLKDRGDGPGAVRLSHVPK